MPPAADTNPNPHLPRSRWDRIAASAGFQRLLLKKKVFIIPAFLFFLVYYLLLPILLAYAPRFMSTPVLGTVTLAYVYALSQFAAGWTIAWLYMRASAGFDRLVREVLSDDGIESDAGEKQIPQDSLRGGR